MHFYDSFHLLWILDIDILQRLHSQRAGDEIFERKFDVCNLKNIYIPSLCRIYQFSYDKYDDFSRPGNHNFLKLFLNILWSLCCLIIRLMDCTRHINFYDCHQIYWNLMYFIILLLLAFNISNKPLKVVCYSDCTTIKCKNHVLQKKKWFHQKDKSDSKFWLEELCLKPL